MGAIYMVLVLRVDVLVDLIHNFLSFLARDMLMQCKRPLVMFHKLCPIN